MPEEELGVVDGDGVEVHPLVVFSEISDRSESNVVHPCGADFAVDSRRRGRKNVLFGVEHSEVYPFFAFRRE